MQPKYPFSEWFKRRLPITLHKGRDFDCQIHSMAQQLRNAATKQNHKVSVSIEGNRLVVINRGKR